MAKEITNPKLRYRFYYYVDGRWEEDCNMLKFYTYKSLINNKNIRGKIRSLKKGNKSGYDIAWRIVKEEVINVGETHFA